MRDPKNAFSPSSPIPFWQRNCALTAVVVAPDKRAHRVAIYPAQSDMRGKLIRAARLNGSCVWLMARRNSIYTLARMHEAAHSAARLHAPA
jgi:hypothetical protein